MTSIADHAVEIVEKLRAGLSVEDFANLRAMHTEGSFVVHRGRSVMAEVRALMLRCEPLLKRSDLAHLLEPDAIYLAAFVDSFARST